MVFIAHSLSLPRYQYADSELISTEFQYFRGGGRRAGVDSKGDLGAMAPKPWDYNVTSSVNSHSRARVCACVCVCMTHTRKNVHTQMHTCTCIISYTHKLQLLLSCDTRARNLRKLSSKFFHLCVDERYSSNMTSTHNH